MAAATEDEIARSERRAMGRYAVIIDTARPMIAPLISSDVGFAFARIDHRHAPR